MVSANLYNEIYLIDPVLDFVDQGLADETLEILRAEHARSTLLALLREIK